MGKVKNWSSLLKKFINELIGESTFGGDDDEGQLTITIYSGYVDASGPLFGVATLRHVDSKESSFIFFSHEGRGMVWHIGGDMELFVNILKMYVDRAAIAEN